MSKRLTLAILLFFALGTLSALAHEPQGKIQLAENDNDGTRIETPNAKAPESGTEGAKKTQKTKDGDKKGDDDPSCEN